MFILINEMNVSNTILYLRKKKKEGLERRLKKFSPIKIKPFPIKEMA